MKSTKPDSTEIIKSHFDALVETTEYYMKSHKAKPDDSGIFAAWIKSLKELVSISKELNGQDQGRPQLCIKCGLFGLPCPTCKAPQCERCGCACVPSLNSMFPANGKSNGKQKTSKLLVLKDSREAKQNPEKKAKIKDPIANLLKDVPLATTMKTAKQVQNDRDYARYKQQYQKLLELIDPDPKCAECGTREQLEINHLEQVQHDLGRLSRWQQLEVYRKDVESGKCNILCRSHNASDGARRLQGKAAYKTK